MQRIANEHLLVETRQELADMLKGALLGCAGGDALGYILERRTPDECRRHIDGILATHETDLVRVHPNPPEEALDPTPDADPVDLRLGQVSDDTQLSLLLARSCLSGRLDRSLFARGLVNIAESPGIVGSGTATRQAIDAMRGLPDPGCWRATAEADERGNGVVMRIAPMALLLDCDDAAMVGAARDHAAQTHGGVFAGEIAAVAALAVRVMARLRLDARAAYRNFATWYLVHLEKAVETHVGALPNVDTFWRNLLLSGGDLTVASSTPCMLPHMLRARWIGMEPEEAAADIGRMVPHEKWKHISGHAAPTLAWALYCAIRYSNDFEAAVRTAIAGGGDVDTTAAITGALVGLANGPDCVPGWLADRLNDRGRPIAAEIDQIVSIVARPAAA